MSKKNMDFIENLIEKIDSVKSIEEENRTILAKVERFSNDSIHRPNHKSPMFTDYDISSDRFRYNYTTTIYANGCDTSNEGYVSVKFTGVDLYVKAVELTCIIALIDAEESRRFIRSFEFSCDFSNHTTDSKDCTFTVDKYLSRSALLAEASELLPDDTLTLHMDIVLVEHVEMQYAFDINTTFVSSCFKTESDTGGPSHYLFLDSLVAERLREESTYFKRILVTPMTEKSSRYMKIPDEEYSSFVDMGCILLGGTSIQVQAIDDVLFLYAVADKYGVSTIIDTCRCLLQSSLPLGYVSEISQFADRYNDVQLKENIKYFLESERKESEIKKHENKTWTCEELTRNSKSYLSFKYQLRASTKDKVEDVFDFYS